MATDWRKVGKVIGKQIECPICKKRIFAALFWKHLMVHGANRR